MLSLRDLVRALTLPPGIAGLRQAHAMLAAAARANAAEDSAAPLFRPADPATVRLRFSS